ncbi:putative immunity protein [Microbacterium halimionae]|uniref:putative immunity protein n=1 Tax=Microbacterium halimionae TaxID=1526413 RepID=UPI0031333D12
MAVSRHRSRRRFVANRAAQAVTSPAAKAAAWAAGQAAGVAHMGGTFSRCGGVRGEGR